MEKGKSISELKKPKTEVQKIRANLVRLRESYRDELKNIEAKIAQIDGGQDEKVKEKEVINH